MSENKNTTYQNLSDAGKVVLRDKFMAVNACIIKKEKKSQTNNLGFHLKDLEKEEQIKPESSRKKKGIKNRVDEDVTGIKGTA